MDNQQSENLTLQMADADRNEQVRILRLLAETGDDAAAEGILLGLRSGERRVREVAIKASTPFLHLPDVTGQLAAIAADPNEKRKLRRTALSYLGGHTFRGDSLPPAAVEALGPFIETDEFRGAVALALARLPLSPGVEGLLQLAIATGNGDERALARRALAGERIVNLGEFDDPAERQHIAQSRELAAGRVFFWIPRHAEMACIVDPVCVVASSGKVA